MDEQMMSDGKMTEGKTNGQAAATNDECPVIYLQKDEPKKRVLLSGFSFVLTIITVIPCGPIMALMLLVGTYGGQAADSWPPSPYAI